VGRLRLRARICPQGPFFFFLFFSLLCFYLKTFANKTLFDSNQFCNL
jgi:hypothetical protein